MDDFATFLRFAHNGTIKELQINSEHLFRLLDLMTAPMKQNGIHFRIVESNPPMRVPVEEIPVETADEPVDNAPEGVTESDNASDQDAA